MAVVLPKHADTDRVEQDINEVGTSDQEIIDLIDRSDEDASTELETIFQGLVDFTDVPPWFTQLATEFTTAFFWQKSNGTERSKEQLERVRQKAYDTRQTRFFPVSIRG